MTFFGSRDLEESFPDDRSSWKRYLPVAPSLPHPINGIQLLLGSKAVLEKPSYIQMTCYEVKLGVLAHYIRGPGSRAGAKKLKLTKASLKQLLLHMPDPVPCGVTSTLRIPPTASMPPLSLLEHIKLKSTKDPPANQFPGFDVRLTIQGHTLDDGNFQKLLRVCNACDINMLVIPAEGSAILTPTPHSTSIFGPRDFC